MAKKQQVMGPMMGQQQRSRQPRGGSMEAMLIQGEAGLNETIDNNFQLVSNPMMQTIGSIMAKDAARGNALQKNLAKGNGIIDTETGELLKDISDRRVRDQIMNYSRGLKSIFAQSGGTNMDIINGEIGDLERAVAEWEKDKTNFGKNLNGPQNSQGGPTEPHYSAGTSTTTLGYNARVYGDDYESVRYNPQTKELEWTLTTDAVTFDDLETEEDRRKGRNLQSFVDRGRELTPEQQADYDRLKSKLSPKSSTVVTQSMLDEGVVLKDAGVTTAIQDNVTALVDMGTTGKAVTRDDNGNVLVPGFDLNKMTNDKSTLITMAWDNHLHISGGKTFVEHWAESHPNDKMEWARQGPNFDHKKLKEEVTNYYQMKFNKQYENGQANYKDNTQAGRLSIKIDEMVDNAFSPNVDAISNEGGTSEQMVGSVIGPEGGKQMRFDAASVVGENGNMKMEVNEDGNFDIMVYNNSTKEFEIKETLNKSSDIERFKRKIKIYFGSTTAF